MNYKLVNDTLLIDIRSIKDETVGDLLGRLFKHSRKTRYKILNEKLLKIDGQDVLKHTKIKGHTLSLKIYFKNHEKKDTDLRIIYEDELFLIIDKPKGMIVHGESDCLNSLVQDYFCEAFPVSRLDKETDGLIMYVKSPLFLGECSKMVEEKAIQRIYLAMVKGEVKGSFVIDKPIGKDRHDAKKRRIAKNGLRAVTRVEVLESHKDHSLLKCELETGRTHQIRVHLQSIGHAILNDELYGEPSKLIEGMGLRAYGLIFYHPLKEEVLKVFKEASF